MSSIYPKKIHFRRGDNYLCNKACYITLEKCTTRKKNVTCLNCLHLLSKEKKK